MSNPVRKNVRIDGSIKVGGASIENLPLENGQIRSRNSSSLDFKGTIERETNTWRQKLEQGIASFDISIEQRIQQAFNKGVEDGRKKEQSDREKYISEHFCSQFAIINTLLNETKQKKFNQMQTKK